MVVQVDPVVSSGVCEDHNSPDEASGDASMGEMCSNVVDHAWRLVVRCGRVNVVLVGELLVEDGVKLREA